MRKRIIGSYMQESNRVRNLRRGKDEKIAKVEKPDVI